MIEILGSCTTASVLEPGKNFGGVSQGDYIWRGEAMFGEYAM